MTEHQIFDEIHAFMNGNWRVDIGSNQWMGNVAAFLARECPKLYKRLVVDFVFDFLNDGLIKPDDARKVIKSILDK